MASVAASRHHAAGLSMTLEIEGAEEDGSGVNAELSAGSKRQHTRRPLRSTSWKSSGRGEGRSRRHVHPGRQTEQRKQEGALGGQDEKDEQRLERAEQANTVKGMHGSLLTVPSLFPTELKERSVGSPCNRPMSPVHRFVSLCCSVKLRVAH
jgi:hypothetical protein